MMHGQKNIKLGKL